MPAISAAHCIPHMLVLFQTEHTKVDLESIVKTLVREGRTIRHRAQHLWVWDGDGDVPMLRIGLAIGDAVQRESAIIAEKLAADRPDHDAIAACDGRIEVGWKSWEEVRDLTFSVNVDLEEALQGITVYLNIDKLSDGSFAKTATPKATPKKKSMKPATAAKRASVEKRLTPLSFVQEMEEELARLDAFARSFDDPSVVPRDFSWESLDRVEHLYRRATSKEAGVAMPPELSDLVARHIGEVLRACIGGAWTATHDEYIGLWKVPLLPRTHVVSPSHIIAVVARNREPGSIRREVEYFDIARRRGALQQMLETRDAELEALTVSLGESLDFERESLDRVERAFVNAASRASDDDRRVLVDRVALYVGEIVVRRKKCAWELEEKPRYVGFGEFHVGSWNPKNAIYAALREKTGTAMRQMVSYVTK